MVYAYEELVDFIAGGTTPQSVVDYTPSAPTKARVEDLIRREKTVGLTADETRELERFLQLEHLLRLAKAKAYQRLAEK